MQDTQQTPVQKAGSKSRKRAGNSKEYTRACDDEKNCWQGKQRGAKWGQWRTGLPVVGSSCSPSGPERTKVTVALSAAFSARNERCSGRVLRIVLIACSYGVDAIGRPFRTLSTSNGCIPAFSATEPACTILTMGNLWLLALEPTPIDFHTIPIAPDWVIVTSRVGAVVAVLVLELTAGGLPLLQTPQTCKRQAGKAPTLRQAAAFLCEMSGTSFKYSAGRTLAAAGLAVRTRERSTVSKVCLHL